MDKMRKHVAAVIVTFFLMVLVAALLLIPVNNVNGKSEDSIMLTDFHMGMVAGAVLNNGNGSIAMMVQNGEIEILNAPPDIVFSDSNRKAFLYMMAHMKAEKELGDVKKWSEYGLDNTEDPKAEMILFLRDGSKVRLFLGDEAPLEDGWYLRKEGEESLYLIDSIPAKMLLYSLNDFREIDVLPRISSSQLADLNSFTMSYGENILEIRGEKRQGKVQFYMTEPFEAALSWKQVAEKLIVPLTNMEMQRFIGDDFSRETYDFSEEGTCTVSMELAGINRTILFSPVNRGEAGFYCANPENGQVILVSKEVSNYLNQTYMDLLEATLYSANAADMEKVVVIAEGIRGEFSIYGQGENLRGVCNGRNIEQEETIHFFKTLTMIPPAGPISKEQEILGNRLLTMYFQRRNGTEDIVELIPVSERRCAVMINGDVSFMTYMATVKEVIRTAKQMF